MNAMESERKPTSGKYFAAVRTVDESATREVSSGCRSSIFSSAKWALALFSVAMMMQQFVVNGLYSVVVSTLERRFELRSTETGIIASCFGATAFFTTIFIAFANENVHKARWYSRGTFLVGTGVFTFAIPHFIAPTYAFSQIDTYNYCGNVTELICNQSSSVRNYRHLLSFSIAMMGAGSCFQHAYGISYLDENVSKSNSAFYNAIFFAVTGLGAALGFLAGGVSLKYYTYITMREEDLTIDNTSDLWVGAWWLCFVIGGAVTMLIAVPIHMFPKYLPGTEKHRENRDSEVQKIAPSKSGGEANSFVRRKSDLTFLLLNKPYMLITVASAVNCALIFGFNTFGAKYLETVFGVTPFQASLIYGACIVVASVTGQTAGGYLIKRWSLTVTGIIKFVIAGGVFSAVCSFGFLVHCGDVDIAGATVPYPNTSYVESPISECNVNCGCSTDRYEPVCSGDIIFFSPCYAGCLQQINETTYGLCSCALDGQYASTIGCNRNACVNLYPFILVVFSCFFSSILTISPCLQITLRCVPFDKRILALSFQRMVILALGVVPGRLIVGFVMDLACVSWGTDCGERGSCRAYKRWDLARNNTILLVSQTIVCAVLYIMAYYTYKPAESATANDEENLTAVQMSDNQAINDRSSS